MCGTPAEQAKCWRGKPPEETPTAKPEESSRGGVRVGGAAFWRDGRRVKQTEVLAFLLHPFLLLQKGGKAVADKCVDSVPVNWEHASLLRDTQVTQTGNSSFSCEKCGNKIKTQGPRNSLDSNLGSTTQWL